MYLLFLWLISFISQVYGEYRASLAFDLVSSRQKNVSERSFVSTYPTVTHIIGKLIEQHVCRLSMFMLA